MAPPVDEEQNEENGGAAVTVNSNSTNSAEGDDAVGAQRYSREDWSEAVQKFVAVRGEENPKTPTLGGGAEEIVGGPKTSTLGSEGEEIVGGSVGEDSMEEAEPKGDVNGEAVGEPGALKSEREAADVVQVEPEVEVEEAAPAPGPSGDVEEEAREVESGDGVALDSESGVNGDAGEESAEDVNGGAVEEVLDVAPTNAEPDVEAAGVEVNSEEVNVVGAEVPVDESSDKVEGEALDVPVEEVVTERETNEGSLEVEAVPSATDGVEEKAIEVSSGDVNEVTEGGDYEEASSEVPAEEARDSVASEAPDAPVEENADVEGAAAKAEPDEGPESQEEANPKYSEGGPAEGTDASVEIVGGSVAEESMEQSEPSEVVDAHVEEVEKVAPSSDVEGKAVEAESRDVSEEASPETPSEAVDASVEGAVAPTDAEPSVETAVLESVPAPSNDVEEKVFEVNSEEATNVTTPDEVDNEAIDAHVEEVVEETSAEPNEEVSEPEAVPVYPDEKSIEVNSGDGSEDAYVEEASPAEEAPEKVFREAVDAPVVEETGDVEDVATSVEPGVESTSDQVEPQMSASETEEKTTTMSTSTPLPAEEELFDLLHWESMGRTSSDTVPDNSQGLPAEGVPSEREAETVSAEDRSFQVEELPQESQAKSQSQSIPTDAKVNEGQVAEILDAESVSAKEESSEELLTVPIEHASEEPSDVLAEACDKDLLTDELEHPTASAANIAPIIGSEAKKLPNTDDDVADGPIKSVGDVTHLLQTVMTDEEVKAAAIRYPEEPVEAETQVLEAETAHEESGVEPVAREFNLNDVSEAPITSEKLGASGDDLASHVVTPYLATALAAASSESEEGTPKAYNLDEVATNLHDAAVKTLEVAEASDVEEKQSSVAKSVAQIVLEKSSNAKDSSEYISGVVQHVAQLAQDAGQSDPNVLPDTVARVFDGETAASPANQVTQHKETTSLGTMVSLFVIWCVSLCASRVSSKDVPSPALKLAAEEVAAVLHTNAPSQPTLAQETATSSH